MLPSDITDITDLVSTDIHSQPHVEVPAAQHDHLEDEGVSSIHEDSPVSIEPSFTKNISTDDIVPCLTQNSYLDYEARDAYLHYEQNLNEAKVLSQGTCWIKVQAPGGMFFSVEFEPAEGAPCTYSNVVQIYSSATDTFVASLYNCFYTSPEKTYYNFASFKLDIFDSRVPYGFVIKLTAHFHKLEIHFSSLTQGYIQTPGFDSGRAYPNNMESWLQVPVPKNHVTMLSFSHLNVADACDFDHVTLFGGGNSSEDRLWQACKGKSPPTDLYDHDLLYVQFKSNSFMSRTGFKLLFSFHKRNAPLPARLENNKWNCSIPNWADFQIHFPCNLDPECAGGEDEAACPYSRGQCGQGRLSIAGRCYVYVEPAKTVSWFDAEVDCREMGGYLASLNTPQEWQQVTDVMKMRTTYDEVFVGLKPADSSLPHFYQNAWQWADKSLAFYTRQVGTTGQRCGHLQPLQPAIVELEHECDHYVNFDYLCELDEELATDESVVRVNNESITILFEAPSAAGWDQKFSHIQCPSGHVTHAFLACDDRSDCWSGGRGVDGAWDMWGAPAIGFCPANMTSLPPSFTCSTGKQHVAYSLVCDHRQDCADGSDETFCVFPPCGGSKPLQCAVSEQCVPSSAWCDGQQHCVDTTDEAECWQIHWRDVIIREPPPAIVTFDPSSIDEGKGGFRVVPYYVFDPSGTLPPCPQTHFQCPGDGYCLPVHTRCNGAYDCPGKEDEVGCDEHVCPGFYRCLATRVCLHPDHMCDGLFQCPQQDDELFCELSCPENCTCHGLAFICARPFPSQDHLRLRYLDARDSGMSPAQLTKNTMLVHVSLARCNLTDLENLDLPNLRSLDLSGNKIRTLSALMFARVRNLQILSLVDNPVTSLSFTDTSTSPPLVFPDLHALHLAGMRITETGSSRLLSCPNLQVLNLSESGVTRILQEGFSSLTQLRVLDVSGCSLEDFPRGIFWGLNNLRSVYAENYKLCCSATLPSDFNPNNCRAPPDAVSSCDALLKSGAHRVYFFVSALTAMLANLTSFVLRVFHFRTGNQSSIEVLITHLSVSNFLMSVYLAVICLADRIHQGTYVWDDVTWRQSLSCSAAGFLHTLSCQMSVFLVGLMTSERLTALRCQRFHMAMSTKCAHIVCALLWFACLLLAVSLSLMTRTSSSFSLTAICIPMSLSNAQPDSRVDTAMTSVMALNFTIFLFIATGQMSIRGVIRTHKTAFLTHKTSQDVNLALRVYHLAIASVLCWFPFTMLGLLSNSGLTTVSDTVTLNAAVYLLPTHAALNPILYLYAALQERRRNERAERLRKYLVAKGRKKLTERREGLGSAEEDCQETTRKGKAQGSAEEG